MKKVVNQQDQIDVFINEGGTISLMSIANGEEIIIAIAKENIGLICGALNRAAKELYDSENMD